MQRLFASASIDVPAHRARPRRSVSDDEGRNLVGTNDAARGSKNSDHESKGGGIACITPEMSREERHHLADHPMSTVRSRGECTAQGADEVQQTVETVRPRDRVRQGKVKHGVSGEGDCTTGRGLGLSMPTRRDEAPDEGQDAEMRHAQQSRVRMIRGGADGVGEPKRTGADKRDVHCSSGNDGVGQYDGLWMIQDEGSFGEGASHSGDIDDGDGNEQMPTAQPTTPESTPTPAEGYRPSSSQTREVDGNPWLENAGVDSGLWTARSNPPMPSGVAQKFRAQTVRQSRDGRGDDETAIDGESCGPYDGKRVDDRISRKDAGEEGGDQVSCGAPGPLHSDFYRRWTSSFD